MSLAGLDLGEARVNVAKVVDVVAAKVAELTIEIPEIVVLPTHDVTFGFRDFDLTGWRRSPSNRLPTRSWCAAPRITYRIFRTFGSDGFFVE
jgi:hypothetical protein